MQWDRYDAENLHFHMTIAENCGPKFGPVWSLLKLRERSFDAMFDNITILREAGVRDGVDLWTVHRTMKFEDKN